jgi:hypothetical protein
MKKKIVPLASTKSKKAKKIKLPYTSIPFDQTNRFGFRYNGYDYGYTNLAKYEYDSVYDRDNNYSSIVNGRITKIYPEVLYKLIAGHKKIKSINDYCLDRFIRKSFTHDIVSFKSKRGYYGDEADFSIDASFSESLNQFIDKLNSNNGTNDIDTQLIEEVLVLEYGYILPELKNKIWMFENVLLNMVNPAAGMRHVTKSIVDEYKKQTIDDEYNLTCLCSNSGAEIYRLIDGYHRYAAAIQLGQIKINAIVGM